MEFIAILICGIAAVATALLVIFSKNTVHSALWMVGNCLVLAVLFLLLNSEFIAIMQVIVYAGAIMMFILYAIMMLNLRASDEKNLGKGILTCRFTIIALFFIGLMVLGVGLSPLALKGQMAPHAIESFGEVNLIANYIFVEGLAPFELVSVLLTAAVVGAVFLARRDS
jgi:NADH-quinone oxidoreductase subunit J